MRWWASSQVQSSRLGGWRKTASRFRRGVGSTVSSFGRRGRRVFGGSVPMLLESSPTIPMCGEENEEGHDGAEAYDRPECLCALGGGTDGHGFRRGVRPTYGIANFQTDHKFP